MVMRRFRRPAWAVIVNSSVLLMLFSLALGALVAVVFAGIFGVGYVAVVAGLFAMGSGFASWGWVRRWAKEKYGAYFVQDRTRKMEDEVWELDRSLGTMLSEHPAFVENPAAARKEAHFEVADGFWVCGLCQKITDTIWIGAVVAGRNGRLDRARTGLHRECGESERGREFLMLKRWYGM